MQFPDGISGCEAHGDCFNGGRCTVVAKANFTWCDCPYLYDPLDNCQSHYYTHNVRAHYTAIGVNLLLSVLGFTVLIALVFHPLVYELRRWHRNWPEWPRPMLVMTASIVLLSVLSMLAALFYVIGLGEIGRHVHSVTTNVFVGSVVALWYFSFVLMVRTRDLGQFARKWRILGYVVAVSGSVGLAVSLLAGLFRPFFRSADALLSALVIVGMVVGVIVPVLIVVPVYGVTLRWLSRQDYAESGVLSALWRCLWISVTETIVMTVTFVFILAMGSAYPSGLMDVISMRTIYTTVLSQVNAVVIVILVRVSHYGRQARRDGGMSTGGSGTPMSSGKGATMSTADKIVSTNTPDVPDTLPSRRSATPSVPSLSISTMEVSDGTATSSSSSSRA